MFNNQNAGRAGHTLGLGVESIPVLINSSLLPFEYSSHSLQAFLLAFLFHTATRPGFGLPIPSIQQQLDSASYLLLLGGEMLTGPSCQLMEPTLHLTRAEGALAEKGADRGLLMCPWQLSHVA